MLGDSTNEEQEEEEGEEEEGEGGVERGEEGDSSSRKNRGVPENFILNLEDWKGVDNPSLLQKKELGTSEKENHNKINQTDFLGVNN